MKYGVYYRDDKLPYMRACTYRKNRKGLMTAYPLTFDTYEAAEEYAKKIGCTDTKIKEVKA